MRYQVDPFVEKISSPVICRFSGVEKEFDSGKELAGYVFDRRYAVDTIQAVGGKAVVCLKESASSVLPFEEDVV